MYYLYDASATEHPVGGIALNPRYFQRLHRDATSVRIVGDYPEIEAACRAAGVEILGGEAVVEIDDLDETADGMDEKDFLIAELAENGIERDRRSSVATLRKLLAGVTGDED